MVDTSTLIENPRNPNKHPEAQIVALAKIIKYQGWRNPIVVSTRSGFITKGHGRLAAARMLGLAEVPVDHQDYENEASEWADMVADNRIAELAEIDKDELAALITELDGQLDLELTGFDTSSIEGLLSGLDDAPGTGEEPDLGSTDDVGVTSQYGVIVMCQDEQEQEAAYNKLSSEGYTCKVVNV